MRSFLILISLLVSCSAISQIDSLLKVWGDASNHDTIRLNAIQRIAWNEYIFLNPDSAFYYAGLQYDFAKEKNSGIHMGNALHTQGVSWYIKGNNDEALKLYSRSYDIRMKYGDKKGMVKSLNNIGLIYQDQGDYATAIDYYTRSLKLKEDIGDQRGVGMSYINIGRIYADIGEVDKSNEYYQKAHQIISEVGDERVLAGIESNLAWQLRLEGKYQEAIQMYLKSAQKFEEFHDLEGASAPYTSLGLTYEVMADSHCLNGNQTLCEQYFDSAYYYFEFSLELKDKAKNYQDIPLSLNGMARIDLWRNDLEKALKNATKAFELSKDMGSDVGMRSSSDILYTVYQLKGNYKKALDLLEIYVEKDRSLRNEENQREVFKHAMQYEYEKKAEQDSLLAVEAKKVADANLLAQKAENKRRKQQSYILIIGLLIAVVVGFFIFNRLKITRQQKLIIEDQKQEVDHAYIKLEEKNQEILDSIAYAKRIQTAILPPNRMVREYLPNSFVFYKPKDVVAGDFYWMEKVGDQVLFAAADCTGHGVPGAMVSVVCNHALNRSVREYGITEPGELLSKTRELVIKEFEKSEEEVKDGMDIALCSLEGNKLNYAGAHNPLWIIRNGATAIEEIKATKQPIGKFHKQSEFTSHTIQLNKGDTLYIFSDGFADQFGGEKGKKFKAANFKKLLLSIQNLPINKHYELLEQAFDNWKASFEQLDDVCVIGVRV